MSLEKIRCTVVLLTTTTNVLFFYYVVSSVKLKTQTFYSEEPKTNLNECCGLTGNMIQMIFLCFPCVFAWVTYKPCATYIWHIYTIEMFQNHMFFHVQSTCFTWDFNVFKMWPHAREIHVWFIYIYIFFFHIYNVAVVM